MSSTATVDSERGVNESGNRRRVRITLSYTAETHSNGYALDKALFGFNASIDEVVAFNSSPADADLYKYDRANGTIRIYAAGTGTEVVSSLTRSLEVVAEGF